LLERARDAEGWDEMSSCRYSHLNGSCANKHVERLECLGEDKCEFSGMNILMKSGQGKAPAGCGLDKWLGLYCETHKRFFCPGKEHCSTPDAYQKRFAAHQERVLARQPRRLE